MEQAGCKNRWVLLGGFPGFSATYQLPIRQGWCQSRGGDLQPCGCCGHQGPGMALLCPPVRCATLLCTAARGLKASIHPAALNAPPFNPGLPALAYFTLSASRLSCFHIALKTRAYAWLGLCRHSLLFLQSFSFAEYFNNLYWDVFWRRLYFYMDKLHWSKYQVRAVGVANVHVLQVKAAVKLRRFD